MRIVFGWNNFRIKSFTPFELGLTTEPLASYTIEVRQSYFHFFWIPFFGLGKKWAIRKDGKLYELPAVYEAQIRQSGLTHRTPWYTFTGPFLIVFGFFSFILFQKYEDYKSYSYSKKSHEERTALLNTQMSKPDTTDYYRMACSECYSENVILLKVKKVKKNGVLFQRIITPFKDFEMNRYKLNKIIQDNSVPHDSVYITNNLLTKAAIREYDDKNNTGQDIFGDQKKYFVKEIYRVTGPYLTKTGSAGMSGDGYLSFNLTNSDMEADLVALRNVIGDFKWETEVPQHVSISNESWDQRNHINMTCRNYQFGDPYKVELLLKDSGGKEHLFAVEGTNLTTSITKIR